MWLLMAGWTLAGLARIGALGVEVGMEVGLGGMEAVVDGGGVGGEEDDSA